MRAAIRNDPGNRWYSIKYQRFHCYGRGRFCLLWTKYHDLHVKELLAVQAAESGSAIVLGFVLCRAFSGIGAK
jgi:hypothetical protein